MISMKNQITHFLDMISLAGRRLLEMIPSLFLLILLFGGYESMAEPTGLAELRRIAASQGLAEAEQYLDDLPDRLQLDVAHAAANDADPNISTIGINALVQSGYLDEAVPALSLQVVAGDDLTAFGYAWSHGNDSRLAVLMYLKICRYQLARLDSFNGAQRIRVERFLSDGGYVNPLKEFSREAVERRLKQIESEFH